MVLEDPTERSLWSVVCHCWYDHCKRHNCLVGLDLCVSMKRLIHTQRFDSHVTIKNSSGVAAHYGEMSEMSAMLERRDCVASLSSERNGLVLIFLA